MMRVFQILLFFPLLRVRVEILGSRRMGCTVGPGHVGELFNVNRGFKFYVGNGTGANGSRREGVVDSVPGDGNLDSVCFFCLDSRSRRFHFALSVCRVSRVAPHRLTICGLGFVNVCVVGAMFLLRVLSGMNRASQGSDGLVAVLLRGVRRTVRPFDC